METAQSFCKLTIVVDKIFAKDVLTELKTIGVNHLTIETGRSVLLRQVEGLKKILGNGNDTAEDTVNGFSFLVHPSQERDALLHLTGRLRIDVPGKGSIFSKKIELIGSSLPAPSYPLNIPAAEHKIIATKLTGITCITQKGEGNTVAVIGLNTGTAVPTVTFGKGTGLRNRLGLWRILIPAEKEITTIVLDEGDAETVMDMMINAGKLDQPGKGFIYTYPLSMGVLNTKFFAGNTQQAASIEQIVSAIDEIKGTTEWRKKSLSVGGDTGKKRKFLNNLVDFSMYCNEGTGDALTAAAMAAGAAGATVSLVRHVDMADNPGTVSPAREVSAMTIGEKQVETITAALRTAGLFEPAASGEIHASPVIKACTFLG